MKTLLTAFLLLPGAAAHALPFSAIPLGLSSMTMPEGKQLESVPDGTMGPLPPGQCWASQCAGMQEQLDATSAFNTAAALPPDGTRWASPTCTRIPCALVDVPKEEAPADAPIVVTANKRNTGAGSVNATPPGERTIVTTPRGQMSCDAYSCQPVTDEERAEAARKEKEIADRDRGFCPSGNCGSTSDTGGIAAFADDGGSTGGDDSSNEAYAVGNDMGGNDLFNPGATGGSSFDGGSGGRENAGAVAAGQDGKSKAIYKGKVSASDNGGWESLRINGARALSHLEKVAGAINTSGTPSPDDGTSNECAQGSGSGDMTRGACVR